MRAGVIARGPSPEVLPGDLRKFNGEPVEKVFAKPDSNTSKPIK